MKLALVASSYVPRPGRLERHVHELACGCTRRGVQVEVLTQDPPLPLAPLSEFDGFVVRRFIASVGNTRVAVAPGLWEYLRRKAASFDVVHVHAAHASFALAVARACPSRFVFTPHAPIQRLLRWPYAHAMRAAIDGASQIICTSAAERELLRRKLPGVANRVFVVQQGLDVRAIEAAIPFDYPGNVVLTVDRLERYTQIDRAIGAMAALHPSFRLAVVGSGPAQHKLLAHASDLQVSSRVQFVGDAPDAQVYRWLRTARVVLALSVTESSTLPVTEALSAGAPVVASDIPIHHEAASYTDGAAVRFVTPSGSPLEIADRIREAAAFGAGGAISLAMTPRCPTWGEVSETTLELYTAAVDGGSQLASAGG